MDSLSEHFLKGNYSKVIELTNDIDALVLNEDLLIRIKSLRELSMYDKASELINEILNTYQKPTKKENNELIFGILIEYLYILYRVDDRDRFNKINSKIAKLHPKIDDNSFTGKYEALWYYIQGNVKWIRNEIQNAREFYIKSEKVANKYNEDRHVILVENSLGNLALKENKYNDAIKHYEKTLDLATKFNDFKFILYSLSNISNVYRTQGYLEKALEYLNEALAYENKIQNKETQGVLENNIAIIYYHLAQYNAAKEHFQRGIEALKDVPAYHHIAEGLFYYLLTLRETDKSSDFKESLLYFKEISGKANSSIVSFRYLLASAIFYYDQNSIISKAEAMKILTELQEGELSDEFFSLKSSIHACYLFIDELVLFFDIDVLERVRSIINKLRVIADKQDSHILDVEVNRLVAKLDLLEGDAKNAKKLLQQAIEKAERFHLIHLKHKIQEDLLELQTEDEIFPSDDNDSHQLNPILYKEQLYSYQIFLHPIRLCVFKELMNSWSISSADLRKLIKTSWGKLLTHISKMEEDGLIEYKNGFERGSVVKIIELTTLGETKYKEFKKFIEYNL